MFFIPTPSIIPCECLVGVGFLFPFIIDFSSEERGITLATNTVIFPLFLLGYSIVTPYQLHIKSIVSMDYRWRSDGVTMEKVRRNKDEKAQKNKK